jgi:magnesium-transporting ATPase (P-type)
MRIGSNDSKSMSEGAVPDRSNTWRVFFWFLPFFLSFIVFLLSFPIDRRIPFWPHRYLFEVYVDWFLFVTPVVTIVGLVLFILKSRHGYYSRLQKWLFAITFLVTILLNPFILLGLCID